MTRPATPRTQAEAVRQLPEREHRLLVLHALNDLVDRMEAEERDDLAVCRDVAAGEYEDAGMYAQGSSGSWRLASAS